MSKAVKPNQDTRTAILVCGDVLGNFNILFSRVEKIIRKKKLAFECLLCAGEFFGTNMAELKALKTGKIKVPLTTYVLATNNPKYKKFFLSVHNICYLDRKGWITLTSGLKVAYLSGLEKPRKRSAYALNREIYFTEEDVDDLIKNLECESLIDVLLTSTWPEGVTKNAPPVGEEKEKRLSQYMSPLVTKLAKTLQPRYHFCGLADYFYERFPFRNHIEGKESATNPTKFYGLPFVTDSKEFLYAFIIAPAATMDSKDLIKVPGPTTESPYRARDRKKYLKQEKRKAARDRSQAMKRQALEVSKCCFCLANREADRHLIIDVAKHSYLALCKGGLIPEHILIIPIAHVSSSTVLPNQVKEEVNTYKMTLADFFEDQKMDVIFFERNYSSPHMCYQVVPVPKGKKDAFVEEVQHFSRLYDVECIEIVGPDLISKKIEGDGKYFSLELFMDKIHKTKYIYPIGGDGKLPLHFGREFLSSKKLLNLENRIDSKSCEDEESEKYMVQKYKSKLPDYKQGYTWAS